MKKHIIIQINGVDTTAVVEFTYEAAYYGTHNKAPEDCAPGWPESYDVTSLKALGVDMTPMLNNQAVLDSVIQSIKCM